MNTIPLATLESIMLPAMGASADELQQEIDQFLAKVQGCGLLTIRSGDGYELRLEQGGRPWISNDGTIGAADQRPRGIVATMPAGSVYTTVLEDKDDQII